MSSDKKLLVIERSVKLNGDAYRKLEEAGFVIVRGDPAKFHTFPADGVAYSERVLLECAMRAFRAMPESNATLRFKQLLLNHAIEQVEKAQVSP